MPDDPKKKKSWFDEIIDSQTDKRPQQGIEGMGEQQVDEQGNPIQYKKKKLTK